MSGYDRNGAVAQTGTWTSLEEGQHNMLLEDTSMFGIDTASLDGMQMQNDYTMFPDLPGRRPYVYPPPPSQIVQPTQPSPYYVNTGTHIPDWSYAEVLRSTPNSHYCNSICVAQTLNQEGASMRQSQAQHQMRQGSRLPPEGSRKGQQAGRQLSYAEVTQLPTEQGRQSKRDDWPQYSTLNLQEIYAARPRHTVSRRQQDEQPSGTAHYQYQNANTRNRVDPSNNPPSSLTEDALVANSRRSGSASATDTLQDWHLVPKAVGERTGLPINRSSHQYTAHTPTATPPTSFTTHSASSNARRSKRQIMSGEGQYQCDQCPAGFNTAEDRRKHQDRVHGDYSRRPHACQQCDRRFLYSKDLRRHQATHGQAPGIYFCPLTECEFAEKGFFRKDHFDRHLPIHFRPNSAG
ncbi:hypothetical protein LTR37_013653 [Vermiconidia calcicola]|uniref:Uncharacterized protein n=1 Tax=Vermiconidia calcicola TaxID=1690605 RepID=A0ACC3MWN6_9PEZI|nr:hypothetical protein LTR37_013653 [Vermiconidia calcicola]